MLKALTAPPGGGKSKFATKMAGLELIRTNRMIVTNLPIEFEPWVLNGQIQLGLRETLRRKGYPELAKTCHERVRIMTDEETKRFWECRKKTGTEEVVKNAGTALEPIFKLDYTPDNGVLYIIDEAHDHFNALEWQKIGKQCLYYVSKHRHCGDDIWIVSQAMSNVVKQFRVLVQSTVLVRNLGYEKLGFVTLPKATVIKEYLYCPTSFNGQEPMCVTYEKNDSNIWQQCYNTAAAAKAVGGTGDVGKTHVRGLHWGIASGLLVGLGVFIVWATDYFPAKWVENQHAKQAAERQASAPLTALTPTNASPVTQRNSTAETPIVSMVNKEEIYMRGYARSGDGFRIFLTNGEEYHTSEAEVIALEKKKVNISGKWYKLAPSIVNTKKEGNTSANWDDTPVQAKAVNLY